MSATSINITSCKNEKQEIQNFYNLTFGHTDWKLLAGFLFMLQIHFIELLDPFKVISQAETDG